MSLKFAMSKNEKVAAKTKKIFNDKAPLRNRTKSFGDYLNLASREEALSFLDKHHALIFSLLSERFTELIDSPKKGRTHGNDVLNVFTVYVSLLERSARMVLDSKVYLDNYVHAITKGLHPTNKQAIRLAASRLLLYMLEALDIKKKESHSSSLLILFGQMINLHGVFTKEGKVIHSDPTGAISPRAEGHAPGVLAPSGVPPSAEDSKHMLESLLDFIGRREHEFNHWFELIKSHYIVLLYPSIASEIYAVAADTANPDVPPFTCCPAVLTSAFVSRMEDWNARTGIADILWKGVNGALMMEVNRQSCALPIPQEAAAVKQCLLIYRAALFGPAIRKPAGSSMFGDRLQEYWQLNIAAISQIFTTRTSTNTNDSEKVAQASVTAHIDLCRMVLSIYSYYTEQLGSLMSPDTWICLQRVMLQTAHEMLSKASPYAINTVPIVMANELVKDLFFTWLQSKATSQEMWSEFQEQVSSLVHWRAVVAEWKYYMVQLTNKVVDLCYVPLQPPVAPTGAKKKKKERSAGSMIVGFKVRTELVLPQSRDPKVEQLTWTGDVVLALWETIVTIIGNVNHILDPGNFSVAMSCLQEVIDLLVLSEAMIGGGQSPPISLFTRFVPWLLEGCRSEEKRNRGRLVAYTTLCHVFCRHHLTHSHPGLVSHFYQAIRHGLSLGHPSIVYVIFRSASNLFALALPGVCALITDLLREIEHIFRQDSKTPPPEDVQRHAITILGSLLCYGNHFGRSLDEGGDDAISPNTLRDRVGALLLRALNYEQLSVPRNVVLVMNSLVVLVFDDMQHTPRKQVVSLCVKGIVQTCSHRNEVVSRSALDCLSTLAQLHKEFNALDPSIVIGMLTNLCDSVIKLVISGGSSDPNGDDDNGDDDEKYEKHEKDKEKDKDKEKSGAERKKKGDSVQSKWKEQVISNHYFCVLDWMLSAQDNLFHGLEEATANKFLDKLFLAVEMGILGNVPEARLTKDMKVTAVGDNYGGGNFPSYVSPKDKRKTLALKKDRAGSFVVASSGMRAVSERSAEMFRRAWERPTHGSEKIRSAATVFLDAMMAHFSNFPTPAGSVQVISMEHAKEEVPEEDELFFMYNKSVIISVREIPAGPNGRAIVRATVRNCTGRYTWDSLLRYDTKKSRAGKSSRILAGNKSVNRSISYNFNRGSATDKSDDDSPGSPLPVYHRAPDEMPRYMAGNDLKGTNMLGELLNYLDHTHKEILPNENVFFTQPYVPDKKYSDDVRAMQHSLQAQSTTEAAAIVNEVDGQGHRRAPLRLLPQSQEVQGKYHFCRLFLCHFGFMDPEARPTDMSLKMIDAGTRFYRNLKELDKANGREILKIGCIYVKKDQEDQRQILRNDGASKQYCDFVSGLGWSVDLKTHCGFMGGLDPHLTTGLTAPYYANSLLEVVFHDITRMPTNESDPQQIHIKRHVGNDIVHIVWVEGDREYNPMTITSQFNDVHLVIYPLESGLYRFQVFHKQKVPLFGPVYDGLVVCKALLAPLVRQTAINSNRAVRFSTEGYNRPYPTRNKLINEIDSRFSTVLPFEDYYGRLLAAKGEVASALGSRPGASRGGSALGSAPLSPSLKPAAKPTPPSPTSGSPPVPSRSPGPSPSSSPSDHFSPMAAPITPPRPVSSDDVQAASTTPPSTFGGSTFGNNANWRASRAPRRGGASVLGNSNSRGNFFKQQRRGGDEKPATPVEKDTSEDE